MMTTTPSIMSPMTAVNGLSAMRTATTPPDPSRPRRTVRSTPTMRGGDLKPGTARPRSDTRMARTRAAAVKVLVPAGLMPDIVAKGCRTRLLGWRGWTMTT